MKTKIMLEVSDYDKVRSAMQETFIEGFDLCFNEFCKTLKKKSARKAINRMKVLQSVLYGFMDKEKEEEKTKNEM